MEYRHTEDMGEISGFGGGYEKVCQDMLNNGVQWIEKNKNADFRVLESPQIYGIVKLEGNDAENLEKAVMEGIEDCTGAMHHAVMSRLYFIAKNGWRKYCEELRKTEAA